MVEQDDETTNSLNEMKGVDQKHGHYKILVHKFYIYCSVHHNIL